jgi:S-DNA-T family DNA segregation ATPase FtsK/SpoIIIE
MTPRPIYPSPTNNQRLNEILGVLVLAVAILLLLAMVSYAPTDPSLNTVGGVGAKVAGVVRPAHNWIGVAGAYVADAVLQGIGVAGFMLPLLLGRLGYCWVRSRPAGRPTTRLIGAGLWLVFAPTAIALLPWQPLWQGAVPVAGLSGRLVADALVRWLNVPGATAVVVLMVGLSLYLSTTFTFDTAREWTGERFGFLGAVGRWLRSFWVRDEASREDGEEEYGARRARVEAEARRREEREAEGPTLLAGLFGWMGNRKQPTDQLDEKDEDAAGASPWGRVPRLRLDGMAAGAADSAMRGRYAEEPAPVWERAPEQPVAARRLRMEEPAEEEPFAFVSKATPAPRPEFSRIPTPALTPPMPKPQPVAATAASSGGSISFGKRADADVKAVAITAKSVRGYKLPSSSLLYRSDEQTVVREGQLREEAQVLEAKCAEFGVDGQVVQINPGPVVTTFEFRPDAGVKYARVTGMEDDLCLAMAAESVRIERMVGKSTVGIQIPNSERETIWLRDVVECESFAQSKSRLAIALGKDINGGIVTADLAAMPHVLIAGSTGSGKSVAINAMIMSVLFKATPEQVRMILVDPKRVELGMYEGIPHLFTPIITEAKLAANALRNAVREMERRLKLLAANHVRNIDQFNKLFDHGSSYLFEDVNQEPLPYIIIIIDELADLMMLDRANVEESITRLAQMARAVGIHLILATQRPSVDVITGLIKANVPTRMSFRLATKVDSRTIIDSNGAESLLGRGDMLYLPPGTSRVQRVHAPFVTEKEIAAVTEFWRAQGEAEYVHGFLEGPKDEKGDPDEGGEPGSEQNDELYDDAVRLVFEFGKASTSLLQRRLRIGYGRAAALIDMMYNDGLVGPADGSKPRELLKSPDYYREVDAALR